MRSILAASLLLSPMLYSASAVASQPKTDATGTTQERRVSTGVIPPSIDSSTIHIAPAALDGTMAGSAKVVLALNVDEKGNAQNVRVVQSANPNLDSRVIEGVQKSHFRPARLDHQNIPLDVNLVVEVNRQGN
jgi:TonB family protein